MLSLLLVLMTLCGCSGREITETAAENTNDFYSVSNKGQGWGFRKVKGAAPEITAEQARFFDNYNACYMDADGEKVMYLTFDEGYENGYTGKILDILKNENVPAAFFITGDYMKRETELVERMVNEGHIVGNHTLNHPNLHKLESPDKMAAELDGLNDIFCEKFGFSMTYMRPPEGELSERVLAVAESMGYKTVLWSFAYKDWEANRIMGADYALEQVVPYFHDGAILLLHAVSPDNAEALPVIIARAREEGYIFKSLDEL